MAIQINDSNYIDIVKKLVTDDTVSKKGSNLQNIPASKEGKRVRMAFRPPDGWYFIGSDLGQIEPRIQAHIMYTQYGDNSMRQIFVDEVDLYTTMAQMVFGLAEEYCLDKAYDPTGTFQPRKMMKTGVLAKSYGQKPQAFARKMGVSIDVAEHFFTEFDRQFPSFVPMVSDIQEFMRRNGYVETLFGRKRRFPDFKRLEAEAEKSEQRLIQLYTQRKQLRNKRVKSERDFRNLERIEKEIEPLAEVRGLVGYYLRAAFNTVIQGTGADVLKKDMIAIYEACKKYGWFFPASIHDEVKIAVPAKDLTPETIQLVRDCMTKSVELSVPLVTDTVIEERWMLEYDPDKEWDYENCRPIVKKYDDKGNVLPDFEERLKQAKGAA